MLSIERRYRVLTVLADRGTGTAAEIADEMVISEELVEESLDRALRLGFVTADVERTPRYTSKSTAEYEILHHGEQWLVEFEERRDAQADLDRGRDV